jgi:hypothetical protein
LWFIIRDNFIGWCADEPRMLVTEKAAIADSYVAAHGATLRDRNAVAIAQARAQVQISPAGQAAVGNATELARLMKLATDALVLEPSIDIEELKRSKNKQFRDFVIANIRRGTYRPIFKVPTKDNVATADNMFYRVKHKIFHPVYPDSKMSKFVAADKSLKAQFLHKDPKQRRAYQYIEVFDVMSNPVRTLDPRSETFRTGQIGAPMFRVQMTFAQGKIGPRFNLDSVYVLGSHSMHQSREQQIEARPVLSGLNKIQGVGASDAASWDGKGAPAGVDWMSSDKMASQKASEDGRSSTALVVIAQGATTKGYA